MQYCQHFDDQLMEVTHMSLNASNPSLVGFIEEFGIEPAAD
jgi:hypothetical protein